MGRSVVIHSHLTFPPKVRDGVLGPSFTSTPLLSIDAVGSGIWKALHEYINGDTHQRVANHSPIDLINVRPLDFIVGLLGE